jgi:hypothetical protein
MRCNNIRNKGSWILVMREEKQRRLIVAIFTHLTLCETMRFIVNTHIKKKTNPTQILKMNCVEMNDSIHNAVKENLESQKTE